MSVELVRLELDVRLRAAPFVKWAGGKSQLLEQFQPFFPAQFNKYVEPFVGGGAIFFHLYNQNRIANGVILNDLNRELMTCYEVIRDQVDKLIEELRRHEAHKTQKSYFYEIRGWDRQPGIKERSPVERAARTVFLNRTCYNGLYRVNSRGQFNVPFGSYKNPLICDEDNLRAVSQALQGVELRSDDFERCVEWAGPGDFVYLDPPYHPLSETASFTSYTKDDFGEADQTRLAAIFRQLDEMGCRVMLSNSYTSLIKELYIAYRQEVVTATRAINCRGEGRGGIPELVILNY
jgi:DNA adenine methylase